MQKEPVRNKTGREKNKHLLSCTIYTDPLCCWSWAMEPELQRLKEVLGTHAGWTTKMSGLIPSWNNYHDQLNSVTRPMQMGPVWMHAATVANKKINHHLWVKDPPATSYPSCIAVKCAQLQSPELGESLLELLRTAAMTEGKNIARPELIAEIAKSIADKNPSFNITQFIDDFNGDVGAKEFKKDLQETRYHGINRFPSILIRSANGKSILLAGFRLFDDLQKELIAAFPEINVLFDTSTCQT